MFRYYKSGFQNAKPQNLKIILYTLISFVICFVVTRFATALIIRQYMQMQMLAQFGQPVQRLLIPIIGIIVILALLFIFAGYQLIAGATNVIQKAIKKEKVNFSDLFVAFKKGNYAKSLLLALISIALLIIMYVIIALLNYLFNLAITSLFSSLQHVASNGSNAMGILLTVQIILYIITSFILSFVYWLFFIFMINYTVAYNENPTHKPFKNFIERFKGIKNGNKTWFKFYIGVLLINLIAIIFSQPLLTLVRLLTSSISQNAANIIVITTFVIIIILKLFIYYVLIMGIINYFIKRGKRLNKSTKQTRKDNKNQDEVTLANTKDEVKDTTQDKANHHEEKEHRLKDKAESKLDHQHENHSTQKEDVKENVQDKLNDNKDNISDQAKDHFDKK
ncbi:YtxH domain-containing protein [Staphylococcus saccharolyticus]|uniref:Lytic regulatory protein n=2 Tax=Staphylococcus saccharolyticus TaxID=33028 RepID=A0A380H1B9_9STAP|nr:YtxH domain-containing protein [Staphylococcus saccharolyticus]MBL7566008.1 YtxH domain-containing protein [Staphylococcus saccharolyticus]MBL7572447.1 YtxH domain-containing protein [Staphylococcus saccharolyticus]QQB98642.1 YtxH domain-containing protein [Staphylococcus saccharolyticus]QRJ67142.1 YtxH domain-containing protein [Staphylococcus saccharolyticus]RTX98310.1 YtxH domain-containing protein [Staphylococcus saccharolyticus]